MFKKISIIFAMMLVLSVFMVACGNENENENENETETSTEENNNQEENEEVTEELETVTVKTTLYPIENFTNRIGGDHVQVENIVPIGADAHTFEPTANQMIEVAEADLFIYNGADFEGFADSIIDAVANHDVMVLEATDGLDLIGYDHDDHGHEENDDHDHDHGNNDEHNHDHGNNDDHDNDHGNNDEHNHDHGNNDEHNHDHENNDEHNHDHDHEHNDDNHGHEENNDHGHNDDGHDHDHDHGDQDPHVWLDPIIAIDYANNIKHALIDLRPEGEEEFTANFEELKLELEELDEEFQTMADEKVKDTIIVSHAGYGYWENRYDIHQAGIAGLSPTNEPSIQQIQSVISLMEENDLNYVMFEQNIPTNYAETVREEAGAEELWIHNLEALTDEDIENDEDYFSLMRHNIEMLEQALQ
ncbi:metal ABC transporter solute-binding protein, Zn/Mn family [Salipaludibacillus sp. HK11]|uniref:metal ABC transporter solute-binding protein, Zn/Mn family n=1 Tax=Salipaludibacillus sp. HK11 TaxID=3394320 RepID=UPI0039FD1B66